MFIFMTSVTKHLNNGYCPNDSSLSQTTQAVCEGMTTISRPQTAALFAGVLVYMLFVALRWCATSQGYGDGAYLQPFSSQSTAAQLSTFMGSFSPRLAVLHTWRDEDVSLLALSDVLDEADWDMAYRTDAGMYETTASVFPLLPMLSQRSSNASLLHISRVAVLSDPTMLAGIATFLADPDQSPFLPSLLTLIQVQGSFRVGGQHATLHYALYTRVFAEEPSHDLIAGARISYTSGTQGFTLSVAYLYGQRAMSELWLARSTLGVLTLQRLRDQGRMLGERLLPQGAATIAEWSLAVHAKPALHLSRQWTLFYCYDRFQPGQGLPKLTEHGIGLKFAPVASVQLRLEVMLQHVAEVSMHPLGGRIAGLIRF
jgi:hypothetical protein